MTTLGQLALRHALAEAATGTRPDAGRIATYFSGATRSGRPIGISSGNWCAASASWSVFTACGDLCKHVPHGWRVGAKELMEDAVKNGHWRAPRDVREGNWRPNPGDLAIYDRSDPANPETSWMGHVNRVIRSTSDGYEAIGGNEGGPTGWKITQRSYNDPRLLGFVAYPQVSDVGMLSILGTMGTVAALTAYALARMARR